MEIIIMSTIDKPLSLEAKNSTVSEFKALVENESAVIESDSSLVGQLGAVLTSSNMSGKYTVNIMSKLNGYLKNNKFVGNIYSSVKNSSSTSNKPTTQSDNASQSNNSYSSHTSDVSQSKPESRLDTELYDKAVALPEAQSVSLYRDENNSSRQYGTSLGGTVFKDFNGTIDTLNKSVQSISGWITLNSKSDIYAWVTNSLNTYIVPLNKVRPEPIVSDFQPLFDKLKDNKCVNDELVITDTAIEQSKAATFKEISSEAINSGSEDTARYAYGSISDLNDEKFNYNFVNCTRVSNTNNEHSEAKAYVPGYKYHDVIYPQQISKRNADVYNSSVYNNVQAVVYDLASEITNDGLEKLDSSFDKSKSMLLCYQQPENISYTAAAQFDSPAPRGTQQPFQFYIAANAMSLNFTLRWHIDELRTLMDVENKSYSIQDIAQIAEDFTRPWKKGNSIEPKLCKVILPGVQHIGYITEAQISYSGDMAGSLSVGAGVLKDKEVARDITDYFYSQIDVTFSMIIIKDIALKSKSDKRREMLINSKEQQSSQSTVQENNPESTNEASEEIKDNSGNQEVEYTSPASSASTNVPITNEISSSDGQNMSVAPQVTQEPVYSYGADANGNALLIDNTNNIVYSSEGEPPGVFKDINSNDELFMANGTPRPVVSQDVDGNRYYLSEDGETVIKVDTSGSDYITNSDGSVSVQIST